MSDPNASSKLVEVQKRIKARQAAEAAMRKELAELKAGRAVSAEAAARAEPKPPAKPVVADVQNLFERMEACGSAAEKYDLACAISAAVGVRPMPPSITTEAGREARMAELSAALQSPSRGPVEAYKIAKQLSALKAGEVPEAGLALSQAAADLRQRHLLALLQAEKDPARRYHLAKLL